MRINFVIPTNNWSGGTRVIGIIAKSLRSRGHKVNLVSQPFNNNTIWRITRGIIRERRLVPPPKPSPYLEELRDVHYTLEVPRPVVADDLPDADVVIATWWETAPWVISLPPSKGSKLYFMQDYGATGQELYNIAPTWSGDFVYVTVSEWLKRLIHVFLPESDVFVMHNAVEPSWLLAKPRFKPPRPVVGLVHRSMRSKGCDIAIRAASLAHETIPNLSVRSFGPEGRPAKSPVFVEHRQQPSDAEVQRIYETSTAWLFSSRLEGFGLPIIEAMARRAPVIATRAGVAPDLIRPGGNGWLVEVDDVAAMAKAIIEVARMDEACWRAMSDAAYATVSTYQWDDAVDVFETALRAAVERSSRKS